MLEELKGRKVYITFDMDGVDPAYAPGVGTAEPSGLTHGYAAEMARWLQEKGQAAEVIEMTAAAETPVDGEGA